MLTSKKVLEIFKDYLLQDTVFEVVKTHHGYTVMCWDGKRKDWIDLQCCRTPFELLEALLNSYESYLNDLVTHSKRELTQQEKNEIQKKKNMMKQKCHVYLDLNNVAN